MKLVVKSLLILAIIMSASSVDAANFGAEKIFVAQKKFSPPKIHRPFTLPIRTPQKDYPSRIPRPPAPRYLPGKPKLSRDNRGGNRNRFVPPQSPHR